MLPFQQQQQQPQQQQGSPNGNVNQLNALRFNGLGPGGFNDMVGFDPNQLMMNPMHMRPSFTPPQQQQPPQPQPQSPQTNVFSPQQNILLQNQALHAQLQQQQARPPMYQGSPMMFQQQQAAMAMNRVKASPSSSPVTAQPPTNLASPMASSASPQQSPMGVDFNVAINHAFPGPQAGSAHSSPQMNRALPQQQQQQQQQPPQPQSQPQQPMYPNPYQIQQQQQQPPPSMPQNMPPSMPQAMPPSMPARASSPFAAQQVASPPVMGAPQHRSPSIDSQVAAGEGGHGQKGDEVTMYVPHVRTIESYGGVDLKYFDKYELKPLVVQLAELGAVDIQALIMSLKSGLKMEVANALNGLTMVTTHTPLALTQCDDLLDVLLDVLDQDFFGYESLSGSGGGSSSSEQEKEEEKDESQINYATLFDMSLDEMKGLIPMLEDSSSEMWLSLRERCLCILNLLRNLSFIPHNMEYLARHERFVSTLLALLKYTRGIKEEDWDDTHRREAWFVGVRRMDTLDHRKSALMIFSNIGVHLKMPSIDVARAFVRLIHDFLTNGPDTYYSLLAIETWAKIAVRFENQRVLAALVASDPAREFPWIEDIWAELSAVVCKDYFGTNGSVLGNIDRDQLAALELVMMGLFDVVMITKDHMALKEQLLIRDKSNPMTILRLCITLAQSGNQHFMVVTRRAMQVVRGLLGNGLVHHNHRSRRHHHHASFHQKTQTAEPTLCPLANKILDVASLREKTVNAMTIPTTDVEILTELIELLDLIEADHAKSSQ